MATPIHVTGYTTDFRHCVAQESRYAGTTDAALVVAPGQDGYLAASDGKIVAIARLDVSGAEPGAFLRVPPAMLDGRKNPVLVQNGEWRKELRGRGNNVKTEVCPLSDNDGRFPDLPRVLPTTTDCIAFRVDARLVAALAAALTTESEPGLTFYVPTAKQQVVTAVAVQGTAGIGAIVPLHVKPEDDSCQRGTYKEICFAFTSAWKASQPAQTAHLVKM